MIPVPWTLRRQSTMLLRQDDITGVKIVSTKLLAQNTKTMLFNAVV